jgi:hypothetical protein
MERTAAYWEAKNKASGIFQWGGVPAPSLATEIAAQLRWRGSRPPKVFVAGAGTSLDAAAIRDALKISGEYVFAPDFTAAAADVQRSLGVSSAVVDLLEFHPEWEDGFDVVYDASFTDVFMSNWKAKEGEPTAKKAVSASARAALVNLLHYAKPRALFVVKSNNQNEEEYASYVARAHKGYEYAPQASWGAAELAAIRGALPMYTTRSGRRSAARNLDMDGHVGFWRLE